MKGIDIEMAYKLKKIVYVIIEKMMDFMWFQSLWAWYISWNPKYDKERYRNAFFISRKRGNKRYCILRCQPSWAILAVARNTLMSCEWAVNHNMIPVIDFEQGDTYRSGQLGKENFWEGIFKQEYSVEDALQGDYVFVGKINMIYSSNKIRKRLLNSKNGGHILIKEDNWRGYYRHLNSYAQKWWQLRDDLKDSFTNTYRSLFKPDMKTLGCFLREEFSMPENVIKGSKYEKHPHCMGVDEMIPIIKEYMEKWNCTHVFVASLYQDSIEKLKTNFGDKLLYIPRERIWLSDWIEKWKCMRDKEDYEDYDETLKEKTRSIKYIEEVYGVSECDCFLGGKASGTLVACIWNGGRFEHLKILEDTHKATGY